MLAMFLDLGAGYMGASDWKLIELCTCAHFSVLYTISLYQQHLTNVTVRLSLREVSGGLPFCTQ